LLLPVLRRQRPLDLVDVPLAVRRVDAQQVVGRDLADLGMQPGPLPVGLLQAREKRRPASASGG